MWQRVLWAGGVVDVDEDVEQGLQGGLAVAAAQPLLEGLLEAFDLATGVGRLGREFFGAMPRRCSSASRAVRPPRPVASRTV